MTKKTYFKGKKKSVKPKKYAFAGFDESTMDNTQMLNAIYNPNYYGDQQPIDTTTTKENIAQNVQLGQTAAMNIQGAQQGTADAMARLQQIKTDADTAQQKQISEMNDANKKQVVTSAGTSLVTGLGDIGKKFGSAAAARATSTNTFTKAPVFSKLGTAPSSKLMNFKVPGMAEAAGKEGLKSTLGSTTWANPAAGNVAAGVGLAASIGGSLWDNLSEDDDPYTYSKKEKWGDWGGNILSEVGTYGGLGSMFGPLGTVIGGVAGLGVGLFKASKESKQNKKVAAEMSAQRAQQEADYRKQMEAYQSNLDKQQRAFDYNKSKIQENIVMGEEKMRQNRLQGLTESQLSGNTSIAMTGGVQKYLKGGANATRVPGGQIIPLKNGAVKFVGNKHSEKKIDGVEGIKLDPYIDKKGKVNYQSEVEHDENMTKLKTSDGEEKEYIYSSYLKLGGRPISHYHDDILASTDDPNVIKMKERELAKIQEAIAYKKGEKDRSPDKIAKYVTGGKKQIPPDSLNYISNTPWSSAFISYVYGNADPKFPTSPTHTGYATGLKGREDWEELDPSTTKLQPGDIIVNNRSGNKQKFGQKSYTGFSHGDIVTRIEGDKVYAIGGNVDPDNVNPNTPDTVAERGKAVKDGVLADSGYFVVLRPKNPQVAKKAVEIATNEKQLWEKNKWNEYADTSQSRLQTYYQSGKLGIPGVKPDDGKPAAVAADTRSAELTAFQNEMVTLADGSQVPRWLQDERMRATGAITPTLSPIDYGLLGLGRAISSGVSGLAGAIGGAWEGFAGTATAPETAAARPATSAPSMAGRGPLMLEPPAPGTAVGRFTGNIGPAKPTTPFRVVPTNTGVVRQPPFYTDPNYINVEGRTIGLNKPSVIDNEMFKQFNIGAPDTTGQKAAEFTPTGFDVKAADGTTVDPGTEGPFPGENQERLPVPDMIKSKDAVLPAFESKKPDIKKNTGLKSKPEFNPMYTKQQIKNARRLAAFGFLSQLAAPTASFFMKPKLVGAPQTINPALLDAAMAAKAVGPMVSPGTVAAPRLGRIAPQTEDILNRSAATKQFMANMGDPSAMVGMLASDTRAAEAERKEMQRAQQINTQLASEEGKIGLQASMANQDASMQSQMANQRNINEAQNRYFDVLSRNQAAQNQAYMANAENRLRADLANADLLAAKQNRDIAALSTMGSNIAGGVGDIFAYGAEEAKAKIAAGDTGVYERNFNSLFFGKTGGAKKKMYGGTNSYTSRLGDLKYKRALKVK